MPVGAAKFGLFAAAGGGSAPIVASGGIITQFPFLQAVLVEASRISSSLPCTLLLMIRSEKSIPSFDLYSIPTILEIELKRSICDIISFEIPGFIFPLQ